jgi:small subunit ribosomal protein S8
MTMTDPIADFLTRLRNAIKARHVVVEVPASKMKIDIARILLQQKYIDSYEVIEDSKQGILRIRLKYVQGRSAITGLKRISKPGLRIYKDAKSIDRVLNGLGIAIISTSRGLKTDKEARNENIGGEVICHIW